MEEEKECEKETESWKRDVEKERRERRKGAQGLIVRPLASS